MTWLNVRVLIVATVVFGCAANIGESTTGQAPPEVTLPQCGVSVVGTWSGPLGPGGGSTITTQVREFRGIPYAEVPIHNRRFAPTEDRMCPPATSAKTFNASDFGNFCVQPGDTDVMGDEDCLFLNVYVPEVIATSPTSLAPVLVYIHGGSLTGGASNWEDLRFLSAFAGGNDRVVAVNNSAVVVTINYRLGVLGFLAAASMCDDKVAVGGACGNFGILDQISALRWVKRHIQSFGGDPTRVNLMGQSSGGTSIFALMGVPSVQGLFRSGISLSGSPNITMGRTQKLAQDLPMLQTLGCTQTDGAAQMQCLRSLTAATVQNAMPNSWNTPNLFSNMHLDNRTIGGEDYAALAYVDGTVIPHAVWPSVAAGLNGNVTLVFGNMGQECNIGGPSTPLYNFTQLEWHSLLRNHILASWPNPSATADKVDEMYRNASSVDVQFASDSFNADYGLTCATRSILQYLAPVAHATRTAPIYVYVNQWAPQNVTASDTSQMYAFHTWDYINACHNWNTGYYPMEDDYELSRLQRSQWYSVWVTGSLASSGTQWAPALSTSPPTFYLFSKTDRYPYRPTGATQDPYNYPGLCDYLVDTMGMDQRYWWVN